MDIVKSVIGFTKKDPLAMLRILLGIIFLSASIHRIIFSDVAYQNFLFLGLNPPGSFVAIVVLVEFLCGMSLLLNRYTFYSLSLLTVLIFSGITASLLKTDPSFFEDATEIFMMGTTPINVWMHFILLVVIISLLFYQISKNN